MYTTSHTRVHQNFRPQFQGPPQMQRPPGPRPGPEWGPRGPHMPPQQPPQYGPPQHQMPHQMPPPHAVSAIDIKLPTYNILPVTPLTRSQPQHSLPVTSLSSSDTTHYYWHGTMQGHHIGQRHHIWPAASPYWVGGNVTTRCQRQMQRHRIASDTIYY